ncbi:MAG: lytic murein transglycosylase [Patescibacteria group bacterium]
MGQTLVGIAILSVVVVGGRQFYVEQGERMQSALSDNSHEIAQTEIFSPTSSGAETRQKGINVIQIDRILAPGSNAWKIVSGASGWSGVPTEKLLASWYLESGMRLGGDGGGAGGYSALRQIVSKQSEPAERHRWHRFRANEQDLLFICQYCGYDCNNIQGSSTGALGPMQFQPSTWMAMLRGSGAVDGDGDGKACPLSLADAMYTAAKKLQKDYEHSNSWNLAVLEYAGGNCARNRAYVRRHNRLEAAFTKYVQNLMQSS